MAARRYSDGDGLRLLRLLVANGPLVGDIG